MPTMAISLSTVRRNLERALAVGHPDVERGDYHFVLLAIAEAALSEVNQSQYAHPGHLPKTKAALAKVWA